MSDEATVLEVASFAIRSAEAGEDGDGRTIEGIAVPYGQPIRGQTKEYGGAVETFERGAFQDAVAEVNAGKRLPIADAHVQYGGVAVGYIDHLEERDDGLHYRGRLLDIGPAREFAARVAARVQGISIEFLPGEVRRGLGRVAHTRVKALGAITGAHYPAFVGTTAAIRSVGGNTVSENETPAPGPTPDPTPGPNPPPDPKPAPAPAVSREQMAVIAQQITDEAIRGYAARAGFSGGAPVDPFAEWRGLTIGQMAQRTVGAGDFAGRKPTREDASWLKWATRTVADTVTTSGANAGMVTPGVFGEVRGIVSRGRPAINAFGGPRAIPSESGMSLDWPYFDGTLTSFIGAQSAEKAEITSAAMNIKKGTEALATYAGGSDISYQLLRRSSPPYLDAYIRILLTAWGVVTDAAFVTELESGSVTSDFAEALATVDATEFKNLVIDASIAVQTATGLPAEFVLASTTAFAQFAKLFTPIVTQPGIANTGIGTLDLRGLTVNVGGLQLIHVPSITAGKMIVSNREAAAWFEDGPFQAQEEDVMHLGRNVAIWSMGAGARFIPAGIIEMYDVVP